MSLDLWKPLKIDNALLQYIFNLPIDGKLNKSGKEQAHPLIIFENKLDKTYYCIRLQTLKFVKENEVRIHNHLYQTESYWNKTKSVAVTSDIFIIDKELLENNIDQDTYEKTFELSNSDKSLIINDLNKRIYSNPPNLNILKISKNLENNLVLHTNDNLINSQLNSTIKSKDYRIKQSTKNYYMYHFNKEKFLNDTNKLNEEYTKEAIKNIKQSINNALKIQGKKLKAKNILSEFDKTPTSFEESEVIKEYKKSFNENKAEDKLNKSKKKENKLKR